MPRVACTAKERRGQEVVELCPVVVVPRGGLAASRTGIPTARAAAAMVIAVPVHEAPRSEVCWYVCEWVGLWVCLWMGLWVGG